ncbi:Immunoglobulin E-set [Penicillium sp. DV-2018c]|nr:Immunoglobulin E-set [Penicillium sp. DV-2018c]KAJ5577063.1 Immunoglobulin E-set [Penicillium sp. DV-2018c]
MASRPRIAIPENPSIEVFVTGTFDDWGKTVKLDRVGDIFMKEVTLSSSEKVHYKFVVDGIWTTDTNVRQEDDGHNNINNVLLPEEIQTVQTDDRSTNVAPTMSGVTPDSTTAALAANVPKELNGNLPGTFPDTPGQESEQSFAVDPIPAAGGYGNPVNLKPGEKVPHPNTLHTNTVDSTVNLDKESYEKGQTLPVGAGNQNSGANTDASAFAIPPVTNNMIPESSLPMGGPAQQAALADPTYNIQSAGPNSTTAALAAEVPLEPKGKQPHSDKPAGDVPQVVRESLAEAGQDPEAAASTPAVEEKKALEAELQKKVPIEESAGAPAPTVTAATQAVAPHLTVPEGVDSSDVSPNSTPPPGHRSGAGAGAAAATPSSVLKNTETTESSGQELKTGREVPLQPETAPAESAGPTVTTGAESAQAPSTSTPKPAEQPAKLSSPTSGGASTNGDKKKKSRLSGMFTKLKEKMK